MPKTRMAVACAAALAAMASQSAGDGFFTYSIEMREVGYSRTLVTSPKQEAILATDGKAVQVVLRTHFRAGRKELAWVMPVPARPTNIKKGEDFVFKKLEEITAPRFYKTVIRNRPLHVGCSAGSGAQVSAIPLPVRVEETGKAGIFKYTVLSATGADELTKWLNENKYRVPASAAAVFKRYVNKGWYWLAMRVRAEAASDQTLTPHPITYTYRSDHLVYPLIISQLSAAPDNEIVLYVVAAHRYSCMNWANMTALELARDHVVGGPSRRLRESSDSPSGTNYEHLVRQFTKEKKGHLFVTEFCQPWELFGHSAGRGRRIDDALDTRLVDSLAGRQTLTRLRAYIPAEHMDQDVMLAAVEDGGWVDNKVHLSSSSVEATTSAAAALPLGPFSMLIAGLWLSARRRCTRALKKCCLALACLGLSVL